ncbi:MAG: hypothetical protein JRH15_02560 [Deltaproteobacteria bacterium]|nr:hypothetical protein [Deltaproteobacteria bacterium]
MSNQNLRHSVIRKSSIIFTVAIFLLGLSGYAGKNAWAFDDNKSIAETIVTATSGEKTTDKGLVPDIVAFDYKNLKNDNSLFLQGFHLVQPDIPNIGNQLAKAGLSGGNTLDQRTRVITVNLRDQKDNGQLPNITAFDLNQIKAKRHLFIERLAMVSF